MTDRKKKDIKTHTKTIAGRKVKVASHDDAMEAAKRAQKQYAQALENLKNR